TAFAQAIGRFFADPALQERLRAEARAFAREWSDDACAKRLAALYSRYCAATENPSREKTGNPA
ncbi:MAG: glycosyltransferase family 4 protein, partial [Zoogloeaceae bacterium]|nr:glycosyltransferase family 4 protein [Zoogloeaceae bacterium]